MRTETYQPQINYFLSTMTGLNAFKTEYPTPKTGLYPSNIPSFQISQMICKESLHLHLIKNGRAL